MPGPLVANKDGKGRIVRVSSNVAHELGASVDALGTPRFGVRRLDLATKLSTADPASHLASAITDGGDGTGISFPLNGSWASTDWSGAYPYVLWSLDDVFGFPLGGAIGTGITLQFVVRATVPGPTDEVRVVFAVVNETDPTTATIDGCGISFLATGVTNPGIEATKTANGTVTSTAGTVGAGIVGVMGTLSIHGQGATGALCCNRVEPLDSSGVLVTSCSALSAASSAALAYGNPTRNYLGLFAGRSSAGAAGAFTVKVDAYTSPMLRSQLVT